MERQHSFGVDSNATVDEINKAFRAAAMEIHPDHNSKLGAAEAFMLIQETRDRLLEEARQHREASPRDAESVQRATDAAAKATANAAYASPGASSTVVAEEPLAEEIAHIQKLDDLAMHYARRNMFARRNDSDDVRRHRRKIETVNRRIDGRY